MKKEIIIMVILGILLIGISFLGYELVEREKNNEEKKENIQLPSKRIEKQTNEIGYVYRPESSSCS